MDKIVIRDMPPDDGEYPLDASSFTNRELHTIKRLSGVRIGEMMDALGAADTDVILSFAVIALQRAGKHVVEDALWDAAAGGISFVLGEPETQEDDAGPPALTPSGPPELPASESGSIGSSGDGSSPPSVSPESDPSPTGSPDSDTGADSDPPTSAT